MNAGVARLVLVLIVLGVAGIVAAVIRRVHQPPHPALAVQSEGERPGVVLFTSLECAACKQAFAMLRSRGLSFREITYEIEPQRFASWRVLAVPLTVVLDVDGTVVDAIAGLPSRRRLTRALRMAGVESSP